MKREILANPTWIVGTIEASKQLTTRSRIGERGDVN
jgi:hypothetical protein